MPSLFTERFQDVAAPMLDDQFSQLVTIGRAASTTAGVAALQDPLETEISDEKTIRTRTEMRVWLIYKTDYLIAGVAVKPAIGDRITDENSSIWECCPDADLPAVEESLNRWLIRTKLIRA